MSKIHFAALIGVDYELDIFNLWIQYYKRMKLDSYKIFLHKEYGTIADSIVNLVKDYNVDVECVGGSQANGGLREEVCRYHASTLDKDDLFVTADGDEFQTVPGGIEGVPAKKAVPPDYRLLEKHYDLISGFMVDRHAEALIPCTGDPFEQYPYEEPYTRDYQKSFIPPFLGATIWLATRRTKVLAARAGYNVAYTGSHLTVDTASNARIAEDFRVVHFAWRESAAAKISVKAYFTIENLDEIFGGRAPDYYREQLLRKTPSYMEAEFAKG
jgi:hypothetical protein